MAKLLDRIGAHPASAASQAVRAEIHRRAQERAQEPSVPVKVTVTDLRMGKMTDLKKPDYVIQYQGTRKSYFSRMTGAGPAFGATLADTPRYEDADEARKIIWLMPSVAGIMCAIKPVAPRKAKR